MKCDLAMSRFRSHWATLSLVAVVALHPGCAGSRSGGIDRDTIRRAEEAVLLQMARADAAWYRQAFVGITAPELQEVIQELANELTEAAECPIPCCVHLVNSPAINAFALPCGDIFVFSGALNLAENRDELAAVLGHEIAHVKHQDALGKLRHEFREAEKAAVMSAVLGAALSGAASGAVSAALAPTLGSVHPALAHAIQKHVFSVPCDVAARLAASLPGPVIHSLMLASIEDYSQEAEFRADRCGLEYLAAAGYDPKAGAEFMRKYTEIKDGRLAAPSEDD